MPGDLGNVVHGTTVATNAVLESKGARVGLITTQGFGQILHLARSQTPGPLAGWIIMVKPDPPASLADTREAVERMDARGETLVPVDVAQVEGIIGDLVSSGVESLTVSLINSYVDGRHEQEIADIVERLHPGFPVTISSAVLPEFREYERTLTACMNSYVRPQVASYVDRLQGALSDLGVKTEVDILRSDAGVMTPKEAARNPVYGVLSGPSGGVAGALYVAARAGFPNVLTFDMGGTSTDVSLCQAGEPTIGRETTIGQFRIKVPSVDVHTVGAGGGSIAHVPPLTGALRVGPQSAGAEPGPAAYGQGGVEPTVTDANVVLGHLPADLIGGEMSLDVEAAKAAVQTIADAMGLSLEQAADGILRIVNENMAGALRVISVQRGHDPREFAMVAFGGAGPLHANAVAELMGSFPVIVPPSPGLLCALGRPCRRLPQRVRADADPAHRRGHRRRAARDFGRARRARPRVDGGAGNRRGRAARRLRRRHALPRPGLRDPGAAGRSLRPRRALQRPARAGLRVPDAQHGVGDRQPACGRHRRSPGARASGGGPGARKPCKRAPTRAPTCIRARASKGRRSSPSSTPRPSSSRATPPRSTATSTC